MAKRKRRTFPHPESKAEGVLEALRSESSQAELYRRHHLIEYQLSKRKQLFLKGHFILSTYEVIHEARDRIGHFITQVYNKKCPRR